MAKALVNVFAVPGKSEQIKDHSSDVIEEVSGLLPLENRSSVPFACRESRQIGWFSESD